MSALARGDYKEGFALFESRFAAVQGTPWERRQHRALLADPRRWQGDALAGRRILVWGEQGYGDIIMALRFLPMLCRRGAGEVVVQCDPALARLARAVSGVNDVVTDEVAVDPQRFDVHCPVMSLPGLFGVRADAIAPGAPYLNVPDDLVQAWAARTAMLHGPRVGLVWTSGSRYADHLRRNVDLSDLAPVFAAVAPLVSLQKGPAAADAAAFGEAIVDWMDECRDFLDTAALVRNLDLVISVDTAVAHLAGALGVPVWLLNRCGGDWRWGSDAEQCAWYPSMRIFRQRQPSRWEPVIGEIASALGARACATEAAR